MMQAFGVAFARTDQGQIVDVDVLVLALAGDQKRDAELARLSQGAASPADVVSAGALMGESVDQASIPQSYAIPAVRAFDLNAPVMDTIDAWMRLTLLSRRLVMPGSINLMDLFDHLPVRAWTSHGPLLPASVSETRRRLRGEGLALSVHSLDRFPPLLDYELPSEVRIADSSRVRLGAYLAPGTTVMHEGFVNFNAGTLGPAMVEGRISQGVVVGADSHIGGGASTMGTLTSSGATISVSLGERCLLGANSGLGIPLGDDCVVEAGLYITAGLPVTRAGRIFKAKELAGMNGIMFRRDGATGIVHCMDNPKVRTLSNALHANDE